MEPRQQPAIELPLFPLDTVLYPGGWLPLRIFESRYLDMVRDCARTGSGFGVVCGRGDRHARVGTEAVIGDFYTTDEGLLGITAFGRRRFAVVSTDTTESGLLRGRVSFLAEPRPAGVPARFGVLSHLLGELVRRAGKNYPVSFDPDDVSRLAWRLAELLPFEKPVRQQLLEMENPEERLERIMDFLDTEDE